MAVLHRTASCCAMWCGAVPCCGRPRCGTGGTDAVLTWNGCYGYMHAHMHACTHAPTSLLFTRNAVLTAKGGLLSSTTVELCGVARMDHTSAAIGMWPCMPPCMAASLDSCELCGCCIAAWIAPCMHDFFYDAWCMVQGTGCCGGRGTISCIRVRACVRACMRPCVCVYVRSR